MEYLPSALSHPHAQRNSNALPCSGEHCLCCTLLSIHANDTNNPSIALALFSSFCTRFLVVLQLEQLQCISLYLCLTFLLYLLLLGMLFSCPCIHDLQSLNVVLCLQSADEIVICHINSPLPLPYIHTHMHTHTQPFPSMAPINTPSCHPSLSPSPHPSFSDLSPHLFSPNHSPFHSPPPLHLLLYHGGFNLVSYLFMLIICSCYAVLFVLLNIPNVKRLCDMIWF